MKRGLCWSTVNQNPRMTDNFVEAESPVGDIVAQIAGITPGVVCYATTMVQDGVNPPIYGERFSFQLKTGTKMKITYSIANNYISFSSS